MHAQHSITKRHKALGELGLCMGQLCEGTAVGGAGHIKPWRSVGIQRGRQHGGGGTALIHQLAVALV